MFSLESPQRGDSNEYTQYTISQYEKENHPKLSQICSYGIFSKKEFETAVVNEPSVFKPLKFYCISQSILIFLTHFLLAGLYKSTESYCFHLEVGMGVSVTL